MAKTSIHYESAWAQNCAFASTSRRFLSGRLAWGNPTATPLRLRRSRKFYRFLSIFTLLSIWHLSRCHHHNFIPFVSRHALGHSLRHSKYFSRKGYLSVAFGASQSFLTSRFLSAWHRRIPLLWRSSGTNCSANSLSPTSANQSLDGGNRRNSKNAIYPPSPWP